MSRTALILSFLLLFTSAAFSDIYKYIDENGVIYYTDAPSGKKAEIVRKDKKISVNKIITYRNYNKYIKKAAKKYQIEPELINAVIKTESNGNYRAISRKGAMGLMQLMPATANEMDVKNPFNPEENIEGGTRYLRYLLEKFNGNLTLALAAYNSGPKTVEKYRSVPPISETRDYVNKVFTLYQGKRDYAVSVPDRMEKPTPIYKIVLEDGTILFTNLSHATTGKLRF
jgi:soluble lytic murein transglycosylase